MPEYYEYHKDKEGGYSFLTDYGLEYSALFVVADFLQSPNVYTFAFSHRTAILKTKEDPKVKRTILRIMFDFVNQNRNAIFFVCDPNDGRHNARMKLFHRWFSQENAAGEYIKSDFFQEDILASLIARKDNPEFEAIKKDIIETFGF